MQQKLVSVIIPTYNSERTIDECLSSLIDQTYENIEIIVVDNNSTDNTKEIVKRHKVLLFNKGPERTAQKNYGTKKSSGEYIVFIDSDMKIGQKVISSCIASIENNKKVSGIIIPERSVGKSFFVKIRDFERKFYNGTDIESARFFKSKDVKKVGGFDTDLIFYEESILPAKIKENIGGNISFRINEYINHNEYDFNIINRLKKKYYYGKSLGDFNKKVSNIKTSKTNIIGRYTIFLKNKNFYKRPILALGVLMLKTTEFGMGYLGYLNNKLGKKTK